MPKGPAPRTEPIVSACRRFRAAAARTASGTLPQPSGKTGAPAHSWFGCTTLQARPGHRDRGRGPQAHAFRYRGPRAGARPQRRLGMSRAGLIQHEGMAGPQAAGGQKRVDGVDTVQAIGEGRPAWVGDRRQGLPLRSPGAVSAAGSGRVTASSRIRPACALSRALPRSRIGQGQDGNERADTFRSLRPVLPCDSARRRTCRRMRDGLPRPSGWGGATPVTS